MKREVSATSGRRAGRSRVGAAMAGFGLFLAVACGPRPAPVRASGPRPDSHERTVFSDTALYRDRCVEADSGLTPSSGHCTLRDQARRQEDVSPHR